MDPAKRHRLLGWLFILGPAVSLILFGLGTWLMFGTSAGEALRATLPRAAPTGPLGGTWLMPNFAYGAIGWLLLTLGCAAGTCLRMFRRRGKTGRSLVVLVVLAAPILALAHVVLVLGILFAGCVAIFGEIQS